MYSIALITCRAFKVFLKIGFGSRPIFFRLEISYLAKLRAMIKKLAQFLQDKSGITENRQRMAKLEQEVQRQNLFNLSFLQLLTADVLPINPSVSNAAVKRLQAQYGLKPFPLAIHKNDVMLAYHLYSNAPNILEAYESYFRVGIRAVKALADLAQAQGWQPQKIMDFGSGYGRMSRFLPQFFQAEIIPTEVKQQAMLFQEEHLGFKGVAHGSQPDDFKAPKVDLIIALSVFSHLPQALTEAWLKTLVSNLQEKGRLVFTYHPLEGYPHLARDHGHYAFLTKNEDLLFPTLDDHLHDAQTYGVSFFTQAFFERFFKEQGWSYQFLENQLATTQKAFAVWKD